jgi:hypothetical protein
VDRLRQALKAWNDEDLDGYLAVTDPALAAGRESGVEVQREFGNVATFSDGLIVELRTYGGWPEALEAVGLAD